jgi:hypothetical protein
VKIYVAAVEALKERGGQHLMKLSLAQKNGAFLSFTPLGRLLYFFTGFSKNLTPVLDQTQDFGALFS